MNWRTFGDKTSSHPDRPAAALSPIPRPLSSGSKQHGPSDILETIVSRWSFFVISGMGRWVTLDQPNLFLVGLQTKPLLRFAETEDSLSVFYYYLLQLEWW
jgi:hypothetical protein